MLAGALTRHGKGKSMELFSEFPELGREDLRDFKKAVDFGFRSFSRAYGDELESFFDPLLHFMIWFEKLLINSPWPVILAVIAALAWLGSRSWKLVAGSVACCIIIGYFGMWENHYFGGDLYLYRAWNSTWYLDGQIKPCSINYHAYS
jgi:hypothetical protein